MNRNSEVETWLQQRDHPMDKAMRAVRDIILAADDRITETIKWKTPTFTDKGNIASFSPSKNLISLMFHRGAEIPGDHPRLVRNMRFESIEDVEARHDDLVAIITAWCDWKDA